MFLIWILDNLSGLVDVDLERAPKSNEYEVVGVKPRLDYLEKTEVNMGGLSKDPDKNRKINESVNANNKFINPSLIYAQEGLYGKPLFIVFQHIFKSMT